MSPITHHFGLIFVVFVIVKRFLFDNVQLYGIKANDFKLDPAFFTINNLTFVHIGIHVDIGITFRTRSGRHFFYLQERFRLPGVAGHAARI
jgi:hypothetical protein